MTYLLLTGVTISFIELAIYLNLIDKGNSIIKRYQKVFLVLSSSHISDHWKEKALPRYAWLLINDSLKAFFTLLVCCIPALVTMELSRRFHPEFQSLLYSWIGIACMTAFSVLYVKVRRQPVGR